jgi:hypothetical protein
MVQKKCLNLNLFNMKNQTLEFVKIGKEYKSAHGGKWFHIYFTSGIKSYRTTLYENMRNFKNWLKVIENAERGDRIANLNFRLYKGKEIVNADSLPILYTKEEWIEKENIRFAQHFGVDWV